MAKSWDFYSYLADEMAKTFEQGRQVWTSNNQAAQRGLAESAYNRALMRYRVSIGEASDSHIPALGYAQG